MDMGETGNGSDTTGNGNTPSKKSIKLDHFTPKEKMPPPPVANVQLRGKINKKINRSTSAWKTLSLNRKDKVKNDNSQIFRSPSIYENNPSNNSSADGDQNPDIENNHHMTASDEIDENKQQNTVM